MLDDDFIVNSIRVDVKTKRRNKTKAFPPPLGYKVNMGSFALKHDLYVFVEVEPRRVGPIENDPAAVILGWGTPELVEAVGTKVKPGHKSDGVGFGFGFERYDWDIEIGTLYTPQTLRERPLSGTSR